MSKMTKSHWVTDHDNMRLTMPFAKVDQERRLVSGYATLDNIDSQGDVVLAEASKAAFARARGNIREMHDNIAVGRLVDFREDEYIDANGELYKGIYVTAYVSKGAESTWEKVLDGTLTGFSIGGNIKDSSTEFVKEANNGEGASVRFIKEYDLVELSLVDNPANQLANVFSIQKASDGSVTMKGMMVETQIENIFWCETDRVARTLDAETAECLNCGNPMKNIGWVENGEQKTEKVREVVSKYLSPDTATNNEGEGGVDVSKFRKSETPGEGEVVAGVDEGREAEANSDDTTAPETTQDPDLGAQVADQSDNPQPAEPDVAEGEVVAGIDEVPVAGNENEDLSKKLDAIHETLTETLKKAQEDTTNAVATLETKVDELNKSFETKTSEFDQRLVELGTKLETAKSSLAEFEKSLETINSSEAIKKSADLEKSAEPKQTETTWNGAFSVNNLLR